MSEKIRKFLTEIAEEHQLITQGHALLMEKIQNFLANLRKEVTVDSSNFKMNHSPGAPAAPRSSKDVLGLFNAPSTAAQNTQRKTQQKLPKPPIQKVPKPSKSNTKSDASTDSKREIINYA